MTVDDAYDDLYYLERSCQIQVMAMSTGRPLNRIPEATPRATSAQFASLSENAEAHFAALKDVLGPGEPEYTS